MTENNVPPVQMPITKAEESEFRRLQLYKARVYFKMLDVNLQLDYYRRPEAYIK